MRKKCKYLKMNWSTSSLFTKLLIYLLHVFQVFTLSSGRL